MDLSYERFDRGAIVTELPTSLAVLLAAAAGRQAGSVTARLQARLVSQPVGSVASSDNGAFNTGTATALAHWVRE